MVTHLKFAHDSPSESQQFEKHCFKACKLQFLLMILHVIAEGVRVQGFTPCCVWNLNTRVCMKLNVCTMYIYSEASLSSVEPASY